MWMFYSGSSKVHKNIQLTILLSNPYYDLNNLKPAYRIGFESHKNAAIFCYRNKKLESDIYTEEIQGKTRYCINLNNFTR